MLDTETQNSISQMLCKTVSVIIVFFLRKAIKDSPSPTKTLQLKADDFSLEVP